MLAPATQDEISFPPAPILCPVIVHVKQPETCICPVGSQRISPPIFIPRVGPLALKTFQRSSPHRRSSFASKNFLPFLLQKFSLRKFLHRQIENNITFRVLRFADHLSGQPSKISKFRRQTTRSMLILHSFINFRYCLASEPYARTRLSG